MTDKIIEKNEGNEGENDKQSDELDDKQLSVKDTRSNLTQAQVDDIVKNRLNRQKKEHEASLENIKSELEDKNSQIETYEKYFTEFITKEIGDLPESVKVIFDKLSLSDKLEWIQKYSSENKGLERQTIPFTPKGKGNEDKTFKPNTKNTFKM